MAQTTLSRADVEALQVAMEQLSEVSDLPQLRKRTVEVVAGLVAGHWVVWNDVDLEAGTVRGTWAREPGARDILTIAEIEARFGANAAEHPVIRHFQQTRDGRPRALSDFLSAAELHATSLYQHLYCQLGVEDQLSFVLPDPRIVVGVAISRRQRGFSARDRLVCNLLRPQILLAYRAAAGHIPGSIDGTPLPERLRRVGLTAREAEVLVLVARGRSTKQVAARLELSPRTVDLHVAHALSKLGVRTRMEAVALLGDQDTRLAPPGACPPPR